MIDQLVMLVGDSAQKSASQRLKKQQQTRSVERSSVTYNDIQNGRFDRSSVKRSGLKSPKKMDARELIPLDDRELNGF